MEQLLKEMENLKIVMMKKSEDRPVSSKYTDHQCIWCDSTDMIERIVMSIRRHYDGMSSTAREIKFI